MKINKERQFFFRPLFTFLLCSLLIAACELFNGAVDPDFLDSLHDEIAWANAERLTITVDYPLSWGSSPQRGTGNCGETRKGYSFEVEFTPAGGFGFSGWLAFRSDVYSNINIAEMPLGDALELSLSENEAAFVIEKIQAGTVFTKVTVDITSPVTIVPFCDTRLRITRSNPPLTQTLNFYPYDQRVSLWFNMKIDPATAILGDTIVVYKDGSDDISNYFTMSLTENDYRLDLNIKNDGQYPATDLQLSSIRVDAGPGIKNLFGFEMAGVQSIMYNTNASLAQKIYEANNIQARRQDGNFFRNSGTQWNNPQIDRRFNQSDKRTAVINFSVEVPVEAPAAPDRVTIIERHYANLTGNEISPVDTPTTHNVSSTSITINHIMQTSESGIIRLVVLPWHSSGINAQDVDEAVAAGRYVTVVMDITAPIAAGSAANITTIAGYTSMGTGSDTGVYIFGRDPELSVSLNRLNNLNDVGISAASAWNQPWTRDDKENMQWKVLIPGAVYDSGWLDIYDDYGDPNSYLISLDTILNFDTIYTVRVQFTDRMGNVLDEELGKIKKIVSVTDPVTNLNVNCNAQGNTITVNWNTPSTMQGAYFYVNGVLRENVTGAGSITRTINTSQINNSNVSSGQAVSNVIRYDIEVVAHSAAGNAVPQEISIWNIPGMSVSLTNRVVEITSAAELADIASNSSGQYVLINDVSISDWTPISSFSGKFYGNGNTIIISGDFGGTTHRGLFGSVSNAVIRDLTVEYNTNITIPAANTRYIGGLVAQTQGSTGINNIIVKGTGTLSLSGSSLEIDAGIITGSTGAGVTIANCYAALGMTIGSSAHINLGGIAGSGGGIINNSVVSGTLAMTGTGSGDHVIGGIIGTMTGTGIYSCNSRAAINIPAAHTASGDTIVGGVAGKIINNINNGIPLMIVRGTVASGDITVESTGTGEIVIGGVCGISEGESAGAKVSFENCEYSGSLISFSRTRTGPGDFVTIGGFIGDVGNFTEFENSRSLSLIKVDTSTVINTSTNLEQLKIGGFAGLLKSGIKKCYSTTSIEVDIRSTDNITGTPNEQARHSFGGFAGTMDNNSTAEQCYATGSITVTSYEKESYRYFAGGFVGVIFADVDIEDCYATGNIMIDRLDGVTTGLIDAGGFGGSVRNSDGSSNTTTNSTIKRCFSVGSFTAKSGSTSNIGGGSVAGLISYLFIGSDIESCVVLGEFVSTQSNSPPTQNFIGRIAGNQPTSTAWKENYVADRLLLFNTDYNVTNPSPTTPSPVGTATNRNGETIKWEIIDRSFYRGLGFNEEIWDLGTPVTRNKWPTLRGMGGQ
ncbi:MAG: hypothetical protein LBU88_00550 [Treponema sp.]|jgi:hypothetical protein|nr:hypothetical protein [Treponema sp.]